MISLKNALFHNFLWNKREYLILFPNLDIFAFHGLTKIEIDMEKTPSRFMRQLT